MIFQSLSKICVKHTHNIHGTKELYVRKVGSSYEYMHSKSRKYNTNTSRINQIGH